jgi:RNA polymerase sigma-70 factor (ECF subfamily)
VPSALNVLDGLVAGDEGALASAYDLYAGRVFRLALSIVRDASRAEEVTQDVFVAAWRHRSEFDRNRGSVSAWLLATARNRAIDLTRAHWRRQRLECAIPLHARALQDVEETVLTGLQQRAVAIAVAALPDDQRHVIERSYFGDQSALQIAAATGIPISTVKGRIRLGRHRLARDAALQSAIRLGVA